MAVDILSINVDISDEEQVFTNIYQADFWTQGSGPDSNPPKCRALSYNITGHFYDPTYVTILDLGYGDWQLMKEMIISETKNYKGFAYSKGCIGQTNK